MEEAASPGRNWGTPPRPQPHLEGKVPDSQETSIFSGWAWLPLRQSCGRRWETPLLSHHPIWEVAAGKVRGRTCWGRAPRWGPGCRGHLRSCAPGLSLLLWKMGWCYSSPRVGRIN